LRESGQSPVNYVEGTPQSFHFDLCDVIDCGASSVTWRGYDLYLGAAPGVQADCSRGSNPCGPLGCLHSLCSDWGQVIAWTGPFWTPNYFYGSQGKANQIKFQKILQGASGQQKVNPVMLSIYRMNGGFFPQSDDDSKVLYLILGVDQTGADAQGIIKINFTGKAQAQTPQTNFFMNKTSTEMEPGLDSRVRVTDYTKLTAQEAIELATGYGRGNMWLDWLVSTAREQRMEDCVACASARPHLYTEPAPLYPDDTWGYNCMLGLTREGTPLNCSTLAAIFPPIDNRTKPAPFEPVKGNQTYTCFKFNSKTRAGNPTSPRILLGIIDPNWCSITLGGDEIGTWARSGLYYYCGGRRLTVRIPENSDGVCSMVRLATSLLLLGERVTPLKVGLRSAAQALIRRRRRHVLNKRDLVTEFMGNGNPTYLDVIGVPRGVPNEFKLIDQVAAGFENIPISSALFPITPNKNVDRINYIHYNVLRLANLTRDAVEGLAEQLGPTSLMAVQNRMALDMVLAEKGGVCTMFGDMCCTFIPNNTAPDGSVTRALEGLRTLSKTMHDHSGLENPVDEWFNKVFGQWKGFIISLLMSLATFAGILVTCGCCCVPCIRFLCIQCITRTIEGGVKGPPPAYQMPLLGVVSEELEWEPAGAATTDCEL
uniref:Uncharacterized protein n=1 Tax=Amphilophus citrinellus TaxID=61819 RepID=A0A3Q0RM62_AMPCI